MGKTKFAAKVVLEQLFDYDSVFFSSDSDGEEGEDVYAYCRPTLSTSTLRGDFGEHVIR